MKLKSFFWQVFFALAIICFGSLILYQELDHKIADNRISLVVTFVSALAASLFLAWRLSRPLELLRGHLKNMAEGDTSEKVESLDTEVVEIHELAVAMEKVRDQLQRRFETILNQKNEQDALLASMAEGVVAIDHDYKVLLINRAAGQILKVTPSDVIGKPFHEVIRVAEVLETVEDSLQRAEMLERDIELSTAKDTKYLQIHTSPLRLAGGGKFGVVMVFSDVTRLRELEGMRRNFVANVSHELRTPLTSIQGFAETLMNPAVSDPTEIKKFLQIIQRHAARLGRIIEDILTLSRIERDAEGSQIDLKVEKLKPTLQSALELCQVKAEKKHIPLDLICPEDLKVAMDPYLMEQAIVNLIDNAIRYSDEGKPIHVTAERYGNEVQIKIKDNGVGIPEKEVGRIFERFYRIDKARSRELGGTGLGLSIVKHISLAHKGRVEVVSQIGQGSQFTIHLPAV